MSSIAAPGSLGCCQSIAHPSSNDGGSLGLSLDGDFLAELLTSLPLKEHLVLRASSAALRGAVTGDPKFWDEVLRERTTRGVQKDAFIHWQRYKTWIRDALERGRLRHLRRMFSALRQIHRPSQPLRNSAWSGRVRVAFRALADKTQQSKLLRYCLQGLSMNLAMRRLEKESEKVVTQMQPFVDEAAKTAAASSASCGADSMSAAPQQDAPRSGPSWRRSPPEGSNLAEWARLVEAMTAKRNAQNGVAFVVEHAG